MTLARRQRTMIKYLKATADHGSGLDTRVTDLENRVIFWNRGAERILGWTAAEALGASTYDQLSPTLAEEIRSMNAKVANIG